MKAKLLVTTMMVVALCATGALAATTETALKQIERIQIPSAALEGSNGVVYYYFVNRSGWGAPGCASAPYAYISADEPGAKEMLSLALFAKASGQYVKFSGSCEGASYIRVTYMALY